MITKEVIQRTLQISRGNSQATAFTVDRGGKQYIVTARHAVEGIASGERIFVVHEKQRKPVEIQVVGVGEGEVDVAVLACQQQLSPTYPLAPTSAGLVYGQQVYFLGFPFGWDAGGENINHGLPMPFVKSGVISGWVTSDTVNEIYIDAHANEGFSGGPLLFSLFDDQREVFRVAGVVSGYPRRFQPVVDGHGKTVARAQENPGLVLAINIFHVVALIDANPIGFALPSQA